MLIGNGFRVGSFERCWDNLDYKGYRLVRCRGIIFIWCFVIMMDFYMIKDIFEWDKKVYWFKWLKRVLSIKNI